MSQIIEWGQATVSKTLAVAADVHLLELVPDGGTVEFEPGSHIDVTVHVRGQPQTRSYSLINEPHEGRYQIAVRKLDEGRGGSTYMAQLSEGDRLQISQPKNNFQLNYNASSYFLVAGGIGITPLIAMARVLIARGANVSMIYLGRSRESMPFLEELASLMGPRLRIHADNEHGPIKLLEVLVGFDKDGEVYACGPTPMLEALRHVWVQDERSLPKLRYESFASSGHLVAKAFVVKIPRLNIEFTVPTNQTMLEALEEFGAEPIYNCRRGECGLCAVDILNVTDDIDHRDVFFSDEQKRESSRMCSCVSRLAGGCVTIDLP